MWMVKDIKLLKKYTTDCYKIKGYSKLCFDWKSCSQHSQE